MSEKTTLDTMPAAIRHTFLSFIEALELFLRTEEDRAHLRYRLGSQQAYNVDYYAGLRDAYKNVRLKISCEDELDKPK